MFPLAQYNYYIFFLVTWKFRPKNPGARFELCPHENRREISAGTTRLWESIFNVLSR